MTFSQSVGVLDIGNSRCTGEWRRSRRTNGPTNAELCGVTKTQVLANREIYGTIAIKFLLQNLVQLCCWLAYNRGRPADGRTDARDDKDWIIYKSTRAVPCDAGASLLQQLMWYRLNLWTVPFVRVTFRQRNCNGAIEKRSPPVTTKDMTRYNK